ncbi:Hsp70 family protein [Rubellimicrobium sp. CFH 75288]|uniref:Hsp70 family protein n=1 Tax=Rubellimicrobium sp. CFH 75288 TaxID=2697034 RepID=UPI001411C54F|nr:Hsp70 family protein [Rubellimicrobium sp. CFH 75288]NAZ38360.1 Hsp70 family protein [Rubellimicrobium sp. CFH 75288]
MSETIFGIDFGTTNSLAAVSVGGRALALVDPVTRRPHPSVIWYRGADIVVGREARENMDITEGGAPPGFVRSPKMSLRRDGPIFVDGRPVEPTDAVAEVLRHLKADAAIARGGAPAHDLTRAVFTIPVDFGGPERRALREAARKAGIGVVQFVHEPVAALYAHLRAQPDLGRELARLEGRSILVFDWGGGTLDLTLCRITGGAIMQVRNLGDNEVGGDKFDERLRNHLREKHASAHGLEDITALEQPGMAAKLLHQCEILKIHLSDPKVDTEDVIVRNYLKVDGPGKNLLGSVTRAELEKLSSGIVARGLARIDEILEQAQLTYQDVELCLATGGMVNMPAIRDGLTERFVGRVPRLENGDRIIAEGAAWIAHDGLRLKLSKPIEILVADTSGRGTYHSLVDAGWTLPIENETQNVANTRLFCVDPREGVAVVEVAKPVKLGKSSPDDPRRSLCVVRVEVDPKAQPLLERIECSLQIDHDYVARVNLRSTGRGAQSSEEFHDLEFGLSLAEIPSPDREGDNILSRNSSGPVGQAKPLAHSNLYQRTNVARLVESNQAHGELWKCVPGDLIEQWQPSYFDTRSNAATQRQLDERNFYVPCARCRRRISQIKAEGPVNACSESPNFCGFERPRNPGHQTSGVHRTQ